MPRYLDDEEDFADDDDFTPDEEEDTTDTCPYCRKSVYDDAVQCPHCGQYLSEEDRPRSPKPLWILAGVAICLYLVYRWTFG